LARITANSVSEKMRAPAAFAALNLSLTRAGKFEGILVEAMVFLSKFENLDWFIHPEKIIKDAVGP